jgi:hypothetical protein
MILIIETVASIEYNSERHCSYKRGTSAESQNSEAIRDRWRFGMTVNPLFAKERLSSRHVTAARKSNAALEEVMESVFSVRSVPRLNNKNKLTT